jgi:alpha-L-fucosidase
MIRKLTFIILVLQLVISYSYSQKQYSSDWKSIDNRPVPVWFENAKFGIFIHWGLYSVPAWAPTDGNVYDKYAEWYWFRIKSGKPSQAFVDFHNNNYGNKFQYQDFVKDFNAQLFQPDDWAKIIKNSGAKYVVLTSKHHDGFAMWPSAESWNWNSVDVDPHRDLCGDLTTAVKKSGMHMGFYYSLYEWFNPLYKSNFEKYVQDYMLPQMKDLVARYEPDMLWTDGEWEHTSSDWKSTDFLSWLYNESPVRNSIVVNDRWGKETRGKHGGFFTTEYDLVHDGNANELKFDRPWEECRGIGGSFGYNRNEKLEDYSSSEELIHILINKVARGGNLLLNIGPTADGTIPVIMQQRLADIGAWLQVNGEAIYNTRKWDKTPIINQDSKIFFTSKGEKLYAIVTRWPVKTLVIENMKRVSEIKLLGYDAKLKYRFKGDKLLIDISGINNTELPCSYAWVFQIKQ